MGMASPNGSDSQWSHSCTSTDQDASIEIERCGRAIVELQRPQSRGGRKDAQTDTIL